MLQSLLQQRCALFLGFFSGLSGTLATDLSAVPGSEIFYYEDSEGAKRLHVRLGGCSKAGIQWVARDVQEKDIPFMEDHFFDERVMKNYGSGERREKNATRERLQTIWIPRFDNGHPHGGMTLLKAYLEEGRVHSRQPIGHAVAGGGDGPGVSEVAYGLNPYLDVEGRQERLWGQGIISSVLGEIVESWAPEVRRIGLGVGLDERQHMNMIEAFRCFDNQTLAQLDATSSPKNIASWKAMDQRGFGAAQSRVCVTNGIFNFENPDHPTFDGLESREKEQVFWQNFEADSLMALFDSKRAPSPLSPGVRYQCYDPFGRLRTFSWDQKFNRIKYHFELKLNTSE
ncbi:MAG: hypothetical protein ACK5O7_05930 [Holosporales bacterium]